MDLARHFGPIDIYLFDQLHKGRIASGQKILDAGCGRGRNLVYLMRQRCEVYGADESREAIAAVRALARSLCPALPRENLRVESIEKMSFEDASMDVVISCAVLHFARGHEHFRAMLDGSWRKLAPGGIFFCRLASSIGMEGRFEELGGGIHRLLDGSSRYLVDEARLLALTEELGGDLVEPIKTTIVQGQRCMSTWVLRKRSARRQPYGTS